MVRVSVAMSCRLSVKAAPWTASMTALQTPVAARAGLAHAMKRSAMTKAEGNPPRRGRERSLPFAVRIVSGIEDCPRNAGGVRHTIRELGDFNAAGTRAERVQIVNGCVKWPCGGAISVFPPAAPCPRY